MGGSAARWKEVRPVADREWQLFWNGPGEGKGLQPWRNQKCAHASLRFGCTLAKKCFSSGPGKGKTLNIGTERAWQTQKYDHANVRLDCTSAKEADGGWGRQREQVPACVIT